MLMQEVSRFIHLSHGESKKTDLIIDSQTNLMWTGNVGLFEQKPWVDSMTHVRELNQNGGLFGYNDWRLPEIDELLLIVINLLPNAINNLQLIGFENIPEGFYWSSSTYDNFSFLAMGVHIKCGTVDARNKYNNAPGFYWLTRGDNCKKISF
jgi:Protein of unknown function (DUF1566).